MRSAMEPATDTVHNCSSPHIKAASAASGTRTGTRMRQADQRVGWLGDRCIEY